MFCHHLVTKSTELTNASVTAHDVIDSRWNIF